MKKTKHEIYITNKKLIRDWTDKKICLIHFKMVNFYVRHGMVVVKVLEIISYKQSRWLEKYISCNTQKRNKAKNKFEKDFFKLSNNGFFGKLLKKTVID